MTGGAAVGRGVSEPVDITQAHRPVYRAASGMAKAATDAAEAVGIGRDVVELVDVRVSQINGCARCLSVHVPRARRAGVTQHRLDLLPTWRESSVFTDVERAALEIAELTTNLPHGAALAASGGAGRRGGLTDEQVAAIVWVAIAIGAFNRISIMSGHDALPPREDSAAAQGRDEQTERPTTTGASDE
ncbi:carboxymuconolactone decarboxylase family protein [Georgenia sp. Z1344]|uniref:carboxymuconolactone decarboxylase family protein n=1 Tax=Georgenia sp. Z1344 TaxID=3416706 RepID=UPI003CE81BC3